MTAAVYRHFGAPEVVRIEQLPIPSPKPGEVLITGLGPETSPRASECSRR